MKRNLKDYLHLVQFPLIIAFGLTPMPMILFTYFTPELQEFAWLLPVSYFMLTVVSFFLPGKLRLPYGVVAALGLLLPWCIWTTGESLILALLASGVFAFLLLWSVRIAAWNSDSELHSAWIGVSLGVQILAQIIFSLDLQSFQHPLGPVEPWFYLSFWGTVILCALCMNRKSMNAVTTQQSAVTKAMRRKNVVLVFLLIGLAVLFSLLPSAFGFVATVVKWVWNLIASLEKLKPLETPGPVTRPTETEPEGMPDLELNVGVHTDVLNALFQIIFAIIMLVGTPLVLIIFWKRIKGALQRLWRSMVSLAAAGMTDYEDEITDTRDSVIADQAEVVSVKRRKLIFSDRSMSNAEKIRYRYRQLQGKNPQWHKGTTARENLPEEPAVLYERARYSSHPVTAEDANRFKTETKKL